MDTESELNSKDPRLSLEGCKYHPLILQNTFQRNLSSAVDGISLQAKHTFLQKIHDSFKKILSCCKCDAILKSNSLAFSCGHNFCGDCSDSIDSCVNCQKEGYKICSKIGNLSETLNIIYEIKKNFNAESVIFEMLKFLLAPPEMLVKKEKEIRKNDTPCSNTPLAPQCKDRKSKKFASTGKRFKTLLNRTENTKRKLQFNKDQNDINVEQPNLVEHDSECLFLDSSSKRKNDDERKKNGGRERKILSYLEQQPSIVDSPNFKTLRTYSKKSTKRKRSRSSSENDRTSVEKVFEELLKEQNGSKKRKLEGTSQPPENDTKAADDCNAKVTTKKRRSSKRINDELKCENVTTAEGETNEKDVESISDKNTLTKKNSQIASGTKTPGCDRNMNSNRRSPLLKKSIVKRSRNRTVNENAQRELKTVVPEDEEPKKAALVSADRNERQRKSNSENLLKLLNVDEEKRSANSPKTLEIDRKKEKENLLLSLPYTDAEEVVDVNIWEKNDKVNRKKKSLFKSVKERNRKNLFFGRNEDTPFCAKPTVDESDPQNFNIAIAEGADRPQKGERVPSDVKNDGESRTESSRNTSIVSENEKSAEKESGRPKQDDGATKNLNVRNFNKRESSGNRTQCIENLESNDEPNLNVGSVKPAKNNENKDEANSCPQKSNVLERVDRRGSGSKKNVKNRMRRNENVEDHDNERILDTGISERPIQDDADHTNNYEDRVSGDQKERITSQSTDELLRRIVAETLTCKNQNQILGDNEDLNRTPTEEDTVQNVNNREATGGLKTRESKNDDALLETTNSRPHESGRGRCDLPAPNLRVVLTKIDDQRSSAGNEKLSPAECVPARFANENLDGSSKIVEKSSCNPSRRNDDVRTTPAKNVRSEFAPPAGEYSPNCAGDSSPYKANANGLPPFDVGLKQEFESQSSSTRSNSNYTATNMNDISVVVKRLFGSSQTSDEAGGALNKVHEFEHSTPAKTKSVREECATEGHVYSSVGGGGGGEIIEETEIFPSSEENILESVEHETNVSDEDEVSGDSKRAQTKLKCAKLKAAINDQNQKSLVNIKKNFNITSPGLLRVEKCKSRRGHSPPPTGGTPLRENGDFRTPDVLVSEEFVDVTYPTPLKQESSLNITSSFDEEDTLNRIQPLPLTAPETNEELLTLPSSPATRSIACQTTPDLHLALLLREFPHLFGGSALPASVYDTPVESIATGGCSKTPKTPLISGRQVYAAVSSITTSECKRYEREFDDRSVLSDSFRSPAGGDKSSATGLCENVSCFPLPPSTSKKSSSSPTAAAAAAADAEGKLATVRLNFRDEIGVNEREMDARLANTSVGGDSPPRIIRNDEEMSNTRTEKLDVTYCSGLMAVLSGRCDEREPKNESSVCKLSEASNEIDFADCALVDDDTSNVGVKRNVSDDGTEEEVSKIIRAVPDTGAIVDGCDTMRSTEFVESSLIEKKTKGSGAAANKDDLADERAASPETGCLNMDDDDVDFVAGTPTCYAKRCVDDSLEKLRTQSMNAIPSTEKSDPVLFDGGDPNSEKSKSSISSLHPIAEDCEDSLSTRTSKNTANTSAENQRHAAKCSANLFDSVSCKSVPAVYVTTSGLKEIDVKTVKVFCERFSALLLDRLTEKTTHLIVKTDDKKRTCRTFKYLQAVVNCVYIVSVKWLEACLDSNEILNEDCYIPFDSSGECGPLRAYNVKKGVTPSPLSWLRDYCVLFVEPVPRACTLNQLQDIVEKTGATVINSLKDFKRYPAQHHLIIVSDEDENTETSNEEIANWIQMYQAIAIEFNWLLEVIGRNRLVPFAEYELVEIPNELLQQLNFPVEMLQYERDDTEDSE